jgi:hypothetical protein
MDGGAKDDALKLKVVILSRWLFIGGVAPKAQPLRAAKDLEG